MSVQVIARRNQPKLEDKQERKNALLRKCFEEFKGKQHDSSPTVLREWFVRSFSDPQAWFAARLAFTRTTAVMSMMGYVIGLGDRHLENINMDTTTGQTFHVDMNCLFNVAENFKVPEVVLHLVQVVWVVEPLPPHHPECENIYPQVTVAVSSLFLLEDCKSQQSYS